ncbi:hypothetical protein BV20DRAFT_1056764 [Pilatotrama ljubarskyi]|nr:hypothetical protein BV20DRAFT_1056764 [Pilatotrama ljubarskyi]
MSSTTAFPYRDSSVGDLIIRTSDGVGFHVHQRRVSDASSVFSDMFTLPQPAAGEEEADAKPVVDVSEGSVVWSKLLPYVYLAEEPDLSLEDIRHLLDAARKYQIPGVTSRMRVHLLRPDCLEDPFSAYALACAGGFEDVARVAAKRTLALPIYPPDAPEYACVSGRAIFRLFEYRQRCAAVARAVCHLENRRATLDSDWIVETIPQTCNDSSCRRQGDYLSQFDGRGGASCPISWLNYVDAVAKALEVLPHDGIPETPAYLQSAIEAVVATRCTTCAPAAYGKATTFSQAFAAKIRDAISQVQLVFES